MFAEILYTSASHSFDLPAPSFAHSFYQLASFNEKKKTLSRVCDTFMIMHGVPWITRSKTHFYLSQTAAVLLWRYTNDTTDLRWAILINMQALSGCSDLWLMKMTALFNKYSQESRCGRVDCLPSLLLHCPWRLLFFWLRRSNFRWRQIVKK